MCEPVVKSDVEFARYLLNPVALQLIIEGSQTGIIKVGCLGLFSALSVNIRIFTFFVFSSQLRSEVLGVLEIVAEAEQPCGDSVGSPTDFLVPQALPTTPAKVRTSIIFQVAVLEN